IGAGAGPDSRFRETLQDVRIWNEVLPPEQVLVAATPEDIGDILAIAPQRRSPGQIQKLRDWFLNHGAPENISLAAYQRDQLRRQRQEFFESIPTTMVMEEMPKPRDTFVLKRGEYDKRGERVTPGIPAILGNLPPGAPSNRLGFARWLVDPANPL